MGVKLNSYAVNQISKGTEIFSENESTANVCLVLKGRVLIQNYGFKTIVGSGSFIGITDLYLSRFVNSYTAFDDVTLFAFDASKPADIEPILLGNKDYSGLMVAVLARTVVEAEKIYTELDTSVRNIYEYLSKTYDDFKAISTKVGYRINTIESLESLEPFPSEQVFNHKQLSYYLGLAKIPLDVQKPFFSYDTTITMRHVEEIASILATYSLESMERSSYVAQLLENIIDDSKECLFNQMIHMAIEVHKLGKKNIELDSMVDKLIDTINSVEKLITSKTSRSIRVDRERMERLYTNLLTGEDMADEQQADASSDRRAGIDGDKAILELRDSLKRILEYSGLPQEDAHEFMNYIAEFRKMPDKFDTADESRLIRRNIMKMFYPLYQTIFMKAYKEKTNDKVIDLFLRYGFLDDALLTREQLIDLYYLPDQFDNSIPCKVYSIKDWLIEIYEGRKAPSKSEFDLDFIEDFREKKKSMRMTPQQEKSYLEDPMRKLNYEIINMFQYNNRLVNGQVATFVPILHRDIFVKDLSTTFVSAAKVNYTINQLREIDYSIFYRETLYFDKEKKIEKEYIQKEVFPDIILLPTSGVNGVMWQEIEGKKRDTSGRFLLPSFAEVELEDMLIKVFGRFRWEICRSIQGTAWNNIKYRSLTSEYVDYIQFYKKNRDLSTETKERIKVQILKGKSNSREIFVIDYVNWIKNESKGSIRLNKYVREIMAMYCPFGKKIRVRLASLPLFDEAMARFNRENMKKIRELELRYKALEKEGITLTKEIIDTSTFYNEM